MSIWVDAKSSTEFDYDLNKTSWSDNITKTATHVAVGFGGNNTIAYSYDGVVWNGIGTNNLLTNGVCVAYNGTIWIVGGSSPTFLYSYDGINWTNIPSTTAGTGITTIGYGIAYGNGLWVALGSGTNTLATSPDGINWTPRGAIFSGIGYGAAYNG
jgi:hypothetical protein